MWPIGTKVECIFSGGVGGHLSVGRIYQISTMCQVCAELSPGNEGFAFIDIVGEPHHNGVKCNAWPAMWFRPIVERKTDISVFKAMLTPAGKKERAS